MTADPRPSLERRDACQPKPSSSSTPLRPSRFWAALCAAVWTVATAQSPCAGLHGLKEASRGSPERPSRTATARGWGGAPLSAHAHWEHSQPRRVRAGSAVAASLASAERTAAAAAAASASEAGAHAQALTVASELSPPHCAPFLLVPWYARPRRGRACVPAGGEDVVAEPLERDRHRYRGGARPGARGELGHVARSPHVSTVAQVQHEERIGRPPAIGREAGERHAQYVLEDSVVH
eukprot:scaffold114277_cov72-Phaeocystis_antarctica.AAC.3